MVPHGTILAQSPYYWHDFYLKLKMLNFKPSGKPGSVDDIKG